MEVLVIRHQERERILSFADQDRRDVQVVDGGIERIHGLVR